MQRVLGIKKSRQRVVGAARDAAHGGGENSGAKALSNEGFAESARVRRSHWKLHCTPTSATFFSV